MRWAAGVATAPVPTPTPSAPSISIARGGTYTLAVRTDGNVHPSVFDIERTQRASMSIILSDPRPSQRCLSAPSSNMNGAGFKSTEELR